MVDLSEEKDAEEVFEEVADKSERLDHGSVFSRREMLQIIRKKFQLFEEKEKVLDAYNAHELTRRDFLKVLGVVSAGGLVGAGARMLIRDPDLTSYATAGSVSELSVSEGSDIAGAINNASGTVVIPNGSYRVENTINVSGGKHVVFDESTIEVPDRKFVMFSSSGQGWQVGGDATINQEGSYPRVLLRGSGNFGDEEGRIRFEGEFGHGGDMWLQVHGSSSDTITINNVTQIEGPPKNKCFNDMLNWNQEPITLKLHGCALGNFHDNGFYVKMMTGRFEAYDSYFPSNNVAAVRNGVNGGVVMKRCLVVNTANSNNARGENLAKDCAGINHSMMSFQDGNHPTGDVLLEKVHYAKEPNSNHGGEFLRDMSTNDGATPAPCTVMIKDCQWHDYPNYGSAESSGPVTVRESGDNGGNPTNKRGPYPFGEGYIDLSSELAAAGSEQKSSPC